MINLLKEVASYPITPTAGVVDAESVRTVRMTILADSGAIIAEGVNTVASCRFLFEPDKRPATSNERLAALSKSRSPRHFRKTLHPQDFTCP